MKYLRLLLFPFSLLYGFVVIIRNWLYDAGLFKSHRFNVPVISVGNLEVGGAGKSPMTEYLVCLLKSDHKLATLSRGYGRRTKGFLIGGTVPGVPSVPNVPGVPLITIGTLAIAAQIGDEPAQFKNKFPDITVAVCEDRVAGINRLLPANDLIILDDAFQHRSVDPGLSILLFDYNRIREPKLLLPAGNFREPFSGRWRAAIIIVTKCPPTLSIEEQFGLAGLIEPLPYQQLYFTGIIYQSLRTLSGAVETTTIDKNTTVFLLTGIANAYPLMQHLKAQTSAIVHHNYPDHHPFTLKNITKLADEFTACKSQKKIIVTTEKDAQRLGEQELLPLIQQLPILVIPIGVEFLNNDKERFDKSILSYVREHTTHHAIH